MSKNFSPVMTVLLAIITCLAGILVLLDKWVLSKNKVVLTKTMRALVASFITFAIYFFAFCLLEITLCAMIELKASNSQTPAWLFFTMSYIPFVYAGTFLWKFQTRFTPSLKELFEPVNQSKFDETLHEPPGVAKKLFPSIDEVQ